MLQTCMFLVARVFLVLRVLLHEAGTAGKAPNGN